MKKILFLFILSIAAISAFSQGAIIFEDCNYRGKSLLLRPGRYNLEQMGFGANKISSIKMYSGYKIVMYTSYDPGSGEKIRLTNSMPCLGSDWNDRVGSVVVEADNTGGGYNPPTQQPSYPSYGNGPQVMIFEDCSLRGNNRSLNPGRYKTRDLGIGNDALSSIRIPSGYNVTVYKDDNFRGSSKTYYSNVYCIESSWNDQVSSVIISGPGSNYNPPVNNNNDYTSGRERIMVYEDCDYRGANNGLSPGRYNTSSLGVGNDRISSLRIPNGFTVTVYQDNNFRGGSRSFYGDEYCLDGQWNERISSIIVDGPGTSNGSNNSPNYNYGNNNSGIIVYMDINYRGSHTIYNEGRFDFRNTFTSANISSFTLQPGYRVTVFEDFGYRGRSQTFSASANNLNSFGWSDKIRSMIVTRSY